MCKFWYLLETWHGWRSAPKDWKINGRQVWKSIIFQLLMTSSVNIKKIIYQSIRLLILIKLFYYEIFWNSSVEKILRLKVLTMTSSVNTYTLIFFKILIIIYHSKDNLMLIMFCYCEVLWEPIEKNISGI